MPKNVLQDVVPRSSRKSIRDIPLLHPAGSPLNNDKKSEESQREIHYIRAEEEIVDWKGEDSGNSGGRFSKWLLWLIGIVSAGVLVTVLANFFSGAIVSVTPRSQAVSVNRMFTAKPNAPAGQLSYTPFPLVREAGTAVPADGEKTSETRASGTIVIYNNFSSASQRLVKNTRFETPDGLIFKIGASVTVPGRRASSGKTVPGSVEAAVYAESAGEEYNIGLTDFTISGFKSNPERFANFYGRSKTAMTGGSIGTVKTASDEKMASAKTKLESELNDALVAEARAALPADSVFYDGAYQIWFEPVVSASDDSKNSVPFRERAHFTAYFIKRSNLAQAIAENSVDNFNNAPVLAQKDANLAFSLTNKNNSGTATVGPIQFNLKGDTTLVWQVDQNKLVMSLAGKNKSELAAVAALDRAILKADAVIRPFWSGAFPKTADKIRVKVAAID